MNTLELKKKLQWQCRRGMLELDVILSPFLEKHFAQLPTTEKDNFTKLLNEADPDLYTWIMGFGECKNQSYAEILKRIRLKMSIA